jgi:hypothetical protein
MRRASLRDDRQVMDLRGHSRCAVVAGGFESVGTEFALPLVDSRGYLVRVARKRGAVDETAGGCRRHSLEVLAVALDLAATHAVDQISSATIGFEVDLKVRNDGTSTCSEEFLYARPRRVAGNHRRQYLRHARPRRPLRQRDLGASCYTACGGLKALSRIFAESLLQRVSTAAVNGHANVAVRVQW